jgi:hypothetical protein
MNNLFISILVASQLCTHSILAETKSYLSSDILVPEKLKKSSAAFLELLNSRKIGDYKTIVDSEILEDGTVINYDSSLSKRIPLESPITSRTKPSIRANFQSKKYYILNEDEWILEYCWESSPGKSQEMFEYAKWIKHEDKWILKMFGLPRDDIQLPFWKAPPNAPKGSGVRGYGVSPK